MKKQSSLKEKIWLYLTLFSFVILISLWLFQVVFLNSYYEWYKKRDLAKIVTQITDSFKEDSSNFETSLDTISFEKGICVEVVTDGETTYSSDHFNRGCMMLNKINKVSDKNYNNDGQFKEDMASNGPKEENVAYQNFRTNFMDSNLKKDSIMLVNPRFHNQTLIYAVKLNKNMYTFISASLQPLDATTKILTSQFVFVTIGVLFLSFLIGYLISKKISKPIVKINEAAKRMANGKYDAVFETKEHIKELNELANTLDYTNKELAGTEELRRELLANVSHDLKTPLTMIKAYAEMVRDLSYKDDNKRNEHLNVIIDETDRLNILVNDILELSKMQSNIAELKIDTFSITDLINNIVNRFQILTETEGYNFTVKGKKKLYVKADQKKIEQVIYNLINNAINYTGDDKLVVIEILELDDKVRINVIDSGNGIHEEELNKIWDKYYKSDKKHKRNAYGTGIGLSIVKQVLEYHNSNYGVNSTIGKGTTFYFELDKEKK